MRGIVFLLMTLVFSSSVAHSETKNFKILKVATLEQLLKKEKVFVYDANVESTRKNVGKIPGAVLLGSSETYDIKKVLPENKNAKLVFYCANKMCTASHVAAERAMKAGYKDVSVMEDGIYGWRDAGKEIEKILAPAAYLDPKEVDLLVKKKSAIIVDVREQEERHEVVPGAKWVPTSLIGTKDWDHQIAQFPKDKTIIFYCAAGVRSRKVAEKLSVQGLKTAYFKSADQWKDSGLPIENGPAK